MTTCPTCARPLPTPKPKPDARRTQWRVRVRLYRAGQDTPEADTDDDRPTDAPGATVLAGLPAVAAHLRTLVDGFHRQRDESVAGVTMDILSRKLKSLRTTLGRGGTGSAVWRVPYSVVPHPPMLNPPPINFDTHITRPFLEGWLARVDVVREVATC